MSLVSDALPGNFSFSDAYGTGEVTSKLKWNPSCNELNDDFSDKLYELTFDVVDNNCPNTAKSSKKIRFLLKKPIVNWDDFRPPNAFSPDGDGINDVFMPEGVIMSGLPFEMVIFNKYGKTIFSTQNTNNGWSGFDQNSTYL